MQFDEFARIERVISEWQEGEVLDLSSAEVPFLPAQFFNDPKFQKLTDLNLMFSCIESLNFLSKLPALKKLDLWRTKIKYLGSPVGNCLEYVRHLEVLNICETRVSDLSNLLPCKSLRVLYCHDTLVSDLSPLSHLENLEEVEITRSLVRNLSPFFGAKKLRKVTFKGVYAGNVYGLSALRDEGVDVTCTY